MACNISYLRGAYHAVSYTHLMYYISSYYRYPKDFESLLYVSQLLQAEAMRHGAVSYTHLDVYKRQALGPSGNSKRRPWMPE